MFRRREGWKVESGKGKGKEEEERTGLEGLV